MHKGRLIAVGYKSVIRFFKIFLKPFFFFYHKKISVLRLISYVNDNY